MNERLPFPEPISPLGVYAAEHAQDPEQGEEHPPTLDKISPARVNAALEAAQQVPIFVDGKKLST